IDRLPAGVSPPVSTEDEGQATGARDEGGMREGRGRVETDAVFIEGSYEMTEESHY
ncbi:hypothetical protein WMY93_034346, partial [Mugilogobius chulae]